MNEPSREEFFVRSMGRLAIGILLTYSLLALGCIGLGWPLTRAAVYTAIAALGGLIAMAIAWVRLGRDSADD